LARHAQPEPLKISATPLPFRANQAAAPRTVRRRLADEGASFQDLADTAHRRLAEAYLRAADEPPKIMAYLLGFSDVSRFSHAVKVWIGKAPGAFLLDSREKN
jgi:AraC-like DNA-binding protein